MNKKRIELLAPAKDLACGKAAIDAGADAVYIGAAKYGARSKAGNSLKDIEALVEYAHTYWARVFVTVNTLLRGEELPHAQRLLWALYKMGVDAAIVQDVGLLELNLPPLPMIASTQMHNSTPDKVAFLEKVGFQRAILARELSLDEIRAIRAKTKMELETFVHGALCVSYSGQCYMSYAIGGRSGNRGECAQPCRRYYRLVDSENQVLADGHLLSLHDLNLSDHLGELLDAGICSFKIEGRLKDENYVRNVVSAYRQRLDKVLAARGWEKSSSGQSKSDFVPNLDKTFNRGYTTHFLHGRGVSPGAIETPKMQGEPLGPVAEVGGVWFRLKRPAKLHNGDGLAFIDQDDILQGTVVTTVHGTKIFPKEMEGITRHLELYRNHDHEFLTRLKKNTFERKISVRLTLEETAKGLRLGALDEDSIQTTVSIDCDKAPAKSPDKVQATTERQLSKTGSTAFICTGVTLAWKTPVFVPVATLNELRRRTLKQLLKARNIHRPVWQRTILKNDVPYPETTISYLGNALNRHAAAFYRRHGATKVTSAAEAGLDMRGRRVMRTRYCLKHHFGLCPRDHKDLKIAEPLYLIDEDGHRFKLAFDCAACEMHVYY